MFDHSTFLLPNTGKMSNEHLGTGLGRHFYVCVGAFLCRTLVSTPVLHFSVQVVLLPAFSKQSC
jgi:hypothetical protein